MQREDELKKLSEKDQRNAPPPKAATPPTAPAPVDLETAPAGTVVEEHTGTDVAKPIEIPADVQKAQAEERARQLAGRGIDPTHPSAVSRMKPPDKAETVATETKS